MPNLPLAPWHGEHGRRAAGIQPLTGQGRRSHDCNLGPATPSDARGCRRIIIPCPRSSQNSLPGLFSGRMESLCVMSCMVPHGVGIVGYAGHSASWRIFPCCSLGQERTCHAGYEVVKVGPYVGQAKSVRMLCSASRTEGSAALMASRTACACSGVRWRCVRW